MRSQPAGDVDYDAAPPAYARVRRPDPHLAAVIGAALGDARTVLNVGAGAGSYEPPGREVTAVEPSASMRAQRPAGLAAAIDAVAEDLPFGDGQFDAAMAIITVAELGAAIVSGRWDAAYGALRTRAWYDGGYRLVVSERPPTAAGR
jgi:hypothetical protein